MKARITFRQRGFAELRLSPEIKAELERRAELIRAGAETAAGVEGYKVSPMDRRRYRAGVAIIATGPAARADRDGHYLIRNLDKGR